MFEQLHSELSRRPSVPGISMIDVLDLPEPLGPALRRMIRDGALTLTELAGELTISAEQARLIGDLLIEKGYSQAGEAHGGEPLYRVRFAPTRRRALPSSLLKSLDEES